MTSPVSASITRSFFHPASQVFDAWLDPGQIGKWMFGPPLREEKVIRMGLEAKVGGKFSFVVEREGKELDHVGEYLEIEQPRRLVFTWGVKGMSDPDKSRVTVEIIPKSDGCELTLTHELDPEWADFAERTKAGWMKMLESLERYLSKNAAA